MSDQRATTLARPAGDLVEGFHGWLVNERRLAASTLEYYVHAARLFLGERGGQDLADLSLGEVSSFMVRECRRLSVGSAKNLATGLRSLLRYLYVEGVTDRELAQAVPAPASRRGGGLPRGLGAEEVMALLAGCDDSTPLGRRDHAIVVMLVRLGLRAGEVAALSLDDVDWIHGEMVVRGKGDHTERLPLPVDVGEALVAYLCDGRPKTTCRALFLRAQAPVGLSAAGVGSVARRACRAAGLLGGGAHRLRHSAATAMLRAGASLDEVGQVLRQRDLQTTSAYARVDFVALRPLALPWPECGT
ncbi:MAG TPA: site-specific integrase [Jiangellaceae bacterium]|nr:site-specific integrase [Jiangellaceae bacterium]